MDEKDPPHTKNSGDSDSESTSLSLPILDDSKNKSEEISEHISSNIDSIENDRSFHEIEVMNNLINPKVEHISQEKPCALDNSDNSEVSLNFIQTLEKQVVPIYKEDINSNNSYNESPKDESFDIFANLDLDDKSLSKMKHSTDISLGEKNLNATNFALNSTESEVTKRLKEFEELVALKDNAIAALTSELDSIKESSNLNTGSTLSTTEYKQLQDEWHVKMAEFTNTVSYKNEIIQQLTDSLEQSVKERNELAQEIEEFKKEMDKLKLKIKNVDEEMPLDEIKSDVHLDKSLESISPRLINENLNKEYVSLEKTLNLQQQKLLQHLNSKFNTILEEEITKHREIYDLEIKTLKDNMAIEKEDFESEIAKHRKLLDDLKFGSDRLLDIRNELETKHSKEMEELRTYFEQKCAELEKNYSDEIFSHHSRKISSSSCSEAELNSDSPFPHPSGPEGDCLHTNQLNLNKKDIINLQNELNSLINKISKCDLDTISDEDFTNLKSEISRSNLMSLLKFDASPVKIKHKNSDSKNYEQKFEEMKDEYEDKLNDAKKKCECEVAYLRDQLENVEKRLNVSSTVQEVGSSGEFEITEVIQSYERRLQEQVSLAKLDIISALESQIQHLASNETSDDEWPTELLRLRDKFKEKYEAQMKALMQDHRSEIETLKEEHLKVLNGALERSRRRSLRDEDSISKMEAQAIREKDILQRQLSALRKLLGELVKYFTQCEDELNNTLVDELLKNGFDKNLTQIEEELNLTNSSPNSSSKTSDSTVTRVHLIPNVTDLINIIESSSTEDGDSRDISIDLKNELELCLEKLKHEANAILALTNNIRCSTDSNSKNLNLEEQVTSLTRKLFMEGQVNDELESKLKEIQVYAETLEKEQDHRSSQKEIVSEDYGEQDSLMQCLDDPMKNLADIEEKARNLLSQQKTGADPALLRLLQELCRVCEKVKEESKRDRYDLIKQIEAADKKYKITQKFLEEQAMEREQERDEAQKRIDSLLHQLKDRDKDKAALERINSEVERLEHQLQEKNAALELALSKIKEVESEKKDSIEKNIILREIIRDLESQTESKSKEIDQYVTAVKKLQCIVEQQDKVSEKLADNSTRNITDVDELYKHLDDLENEVQTLRLQSELAGNEGASKQFRKQLYEIECQVDRKTKELETLHSTASTNCSSPSEDVSAREVVFPKSPKKMEDCEVPLQQLARLKEKLIRHSRAEDAAMKRIRDLEMQVFRLKQEAEETSGEREYLRKQIQEQLVLISDLQIRLDEQRIRGDNIEKQNNTAFELKIYDLQNEIAALQEKLQQKEKTIGHQQVLLAETQERLRNLENELATSKDDELLVGMQKEIEKLRKDNGEMKTKMQNDANMVPNLVENIISDKNSDMARLRMKLDDTEKLLEEYTTLKLDKKDLQTLANIKNNGTSLEELFSILDLSRGDTIRKMEQTSNFSAPGLFVQKKMQEENTLAPDISAILGPGHHSGDVQTRNSTELSAKKVHFEETSHDDFKKEIADLKNQVETRDNRIKELDEQLKILNNLESKIEKLQTALDETEKILSTTKETFEMEQKELKDKINNLTVTITEKKLQLEETQKRIQVLEDDSRRKDAAYQNLVRENKNLEKELNTTKCVLQSKSEELTSYEFLKTTEIAALHKRINHLATELAESDSRYKKIKETLTNNEGEMNKLHVELDSKLDQIESITNELLNTKEKLNKKRKIVRELQDTVESQEKQLDILQGQRKQQDEIILDKSATTDILTEDIDRYKLDISILENDIKKLKQSDVAKLKNQLEEKETKLSGLIEERNRLKELVSEKEKIIVQMAEDSHQLHANLTSIQSKINESGNLIDLGRKLRNEQKKTAELMQEIHSLKAQLMQYRSNDMTSSFDEIADQLKKELDYSNKIDSSILIAVSDQSLNSISETQDVETYKKALAKERLNKKQLLQHVHKLQSKINALQDDLDKERAALNQNKIEEARVIQELKIKLHTLMKSEEEMRKALRDKIAENENLEKEFNSLKAKNSQSESTEYKKLPSNEAIELNQLRKNFDILQGEKNQLTNELNNLKRTHLEMETGYKCTKDMLALEVQRKNKFEEKVHVLLVREKELKDSLMRKNLEMERVVDEMSQEKADLVKQKLELLQRLKCNNPFKSRNIADGQPSGEEFLEKIEELNHALIDNKKFIDLISKLTNEKKRMEYELDIAKRSNKDFNAQVSTNDLMARADYLFAKTLKLESIRKALIFQKSYLMGYLISHKRECPVSALPNPIVQRQHFRLEYTSKHRFRAHVFVVISLIRMKYLVRRWNSGVRLAGNINSRHYKKHTGTGDANHFAYQTSSTRFQVGQPVSSQFFQNVPSAAPATRNLNPFRQQETDIVEEDPWSGNSPPSKENYPFRSKPEMPQVTQLLDQFVERFENIQENLRLG